MIELTSKQLRQAANLKDKIQGLQGELNRLLGGGSPAAKPARKKRRRMSAEGRARISAAQKTRWAKIKAAKK